MIRWRKIGLIFRPQEHDLPHARNYAWVPTPLQLEDGSYKVFYAGRNDDNLSQVGSFCVNLDDPSNIFGVETESVLELGPLGAFDDSAVLPSWFIKVGDELRMYYVGWMQGRRVPYYASVGLAVSYDNALSFKKASRAPLLNRSDIDSFFTASCAVLPRDGGGYHMWYTSNTEWRIIESAPLPRYHLKYAWSADGDTWHRDGTVAIDFANDDEYAISRPWVIRDGENWRMWYSYRGSAYRIGYAESGDGVSWVRRDDIAGIDVSDNGFDSEMIEYAAVVEHNGRRYMFYNGNNYGYDGIGVAVEE